MLLSPPWVWFLLLFILFYFYFFPPQNDHVSFSSCKLCSQPHFQTGLNLGVLFILESPLSHRAQPDCALLCAEAPSPHATLSAQPGWQESECDGHRLLFLSWTSPVVLLKFCQWPHVCHCLYLRPFVAAIQQKPLPEPQQCAEPRKGEWAAFA